MSGKVDAEQGYLQQQNDQLRARAAELEIELAAATARVPANAKDLQVSEGRRAEERLLESEERFSKLFRNGPAMMALSELETGRFLDINDEFIRVSGFSREELVGHTSVQLGWISADRRSRLIASLRGQGRLTGVEVTLTSKAGQTVQCLYSAELVTVGGKQQLLSISHDITARKQMELALRESQEDLAAAQRIAQVGSWRWDLSKDEARWSEQTFRLFGREPGPLEQHGERFLELIHPDDREQVLQVRRDAQAGAAEFDLNYRIRRPDGEERLIHAQGEVLRDTAGKPVMLRGTTYDITERKQAEERRRKDEARLRALVRVLQYRVESAQEFLDHALREAIEFTDSHVGYIYSYDEASRDFELNSWAKADSSCAATGPQTCCNLATTALWRDVVRRRAPMVLNRALHNGEDRREYLECPVHLGSFLTIPVFREDQIVAVVGVAHKSRDYDETDVLQLTLLMDAVWMTLDVRLAEQKLRDANRLHETLAKCIPDLIWSMGLDGRFTYLSPAVERAYGWLRQEALHLTYQDTAPPEQFHEAQLWLRQELELAAMPDYNRNRTMRFEAEQRRKDGTTFRAEITASLIWSDEGKVVGVTGVTRDITQRRSAEAERAELMAQLAQAQKLESIGRLAGGVAHDFNNLLTVINGYSSMVEQQLNHDDPLLSSVQEIHKAGQQATKLTRQLLTFSRRQAVDPKPTELNGLIAAAQETIQRLMGEDVNVEVDLEPELRPIMVDANSVQQILMNLAVNARDAMPNGGVFCIATANVGGGRDSGLEQAEPRAVPNVRLTVSDSGIGITKEVQPHVFEPFFTTKGPGVGTGLGLSTVYGIVRQAGGTIEVKSEPGDGASFAIEWPSIRNEEAETYRAVPDAALRGTEVILIAEDQPEVRKLAAGALSKQGYRVIEASEGPDALMKAKNEPGPIHLLLTDIVMPGMSGKELATLLKPERPGMKVLYMSGYAAGVLGDRGLLELGEYFLAKPFVPRELAAKVRKVLGPMQVSGTVLVVDDEPAVREFFRKVLAEAGYEAITAQNGKEALKLVRSQKVQLVVTDLIMPEQEGIETIQTLHRELPGIGIIAVSGAFGGQFLDMAQALGAHATLSKPVDRAGLLSSVAAVLATVRRKG